MKFDIITIFPQLFESFTREALISRAQKPAQGRSASGGKPIISIHVHNLRDWTHDNHKTVDGRPYGGGAGMVMMVEPIMKAVKKLRGKKKTKVVIFSPSGKRFDQATARRYAKLDQLILICGRYEGIDERVSQFIADEEISIGDYVLFGGEVPAMVVMEAVTRLLPGAVGKEESVANESFSPANLIEHPHYTRPETIKIKNKARSVPKVLLSGNHAKIEKWRSEESIKKTKKQRPDLVKLTK